MGIDAEILIRYRGEKPTEEQMSRWSWDLCRAIGAKKFYISDGLPSAEYKAATKGWHAAFNSHPLYDRYKKDASSKIRNEIVKDIGKFKFQELRRAIQLSRECDDSYEESPSGDGKAYYQDGPTLYAAEGEWFMKVRLWTRYYGVGYERGDLMTICAVAEWVEANIPNAEVWYGGDSSGVEAELFDEAARATLKRHFYSQHGRDYYSGFSRVGSFPTPKPCGLCILGEPRFNQHGFGKNYIGVNCAGCGKTFSSHDGGVTWQEEKEEK